MQLGSLLCKETLRLLIRNFSGLDFFLGGVHLNAHCKHKTVALAIWNLLQTHFNRNHNFHCQVVAKDGRVNGRKKKDRISYFN
jgi:hypothetical protein